MRHRPRKRFGQNFLVDERVVAAILSALAPTRDERVVEIGPGRGALTRPLLARLEHLHVIEIDRDLAGMLATELAPRLIVHTGDVLNFDFAALGRDLRVIGNLPYNISTPVLFRLARFCAHLRDIHVMLQREVVTRMVASPSNSAYGRLSVMLQYRFALEKILAVAPAAFKPAPKVESALVRLTPLRPLPYTAQDEALFARIVSAAFSQRRKTLRNSLARFMAEADFAALAIAPSARAQDLGVREFVAIANHQSNRST